MNEPSHDSPAAQPPGSATLPPGSRTGQASARPETARTVDQIEQAITSRLRRRARRERRIQLGIRIISLVVVLAAWQYYGEHSVAVVFDPLTTVVTALGHLFSSEDLIGAIGYSLWTFAIGYLLGVVLGVAAGMCLGLYRRAEAAVSLYVYALYATPMVAVVPLLSIWMGFGVRTQEVIIAVFVFFPCVVTVSAGVRNLDAELIEVARSLRMNRVSFWRHVLLPGTVPYITAGAAQGVAMGLVGMFIAEIFTQLSGLGDLLETAAQTYHTAQALAVLLVIMTLGVVLRAVITLVQRKVAPWAR